MVVVEHHRLAEVGELEVGEAEAGDRLLRHQRVHVGLEDHLVGDPDGAEEVEPLRVAPDVGEDRLDRRPGQRPPLRAEARRQPLREAAPDPERLLQPGREVLGEVLGLVVEDVPEAPALGAPAAGDPGLVLGFDELAPGVLGEEALEARHRPAGQAGAGQEDRVVGRPSAGRGLRLGLGERVQRRLDQAEAAPAAGDALRDEADPRRVRHRRRQRGEGGLGGAGVEVDQRPGVRGGRDQRAREPGGVLGRSCARIRNRSFVGGRRLPSDMGREWALGG